MMNDKYDDTLRYVEIDEDRERRTGYPEVIFAEGKRKEFILPIFEKISANSNITIATRIDEDVASEIIKVFPNATYSRIAKVLTLHKKEVTKIGRVAVVSAGTSDIDVAEEAAIILEAFGSKVDRLYDLGVAGINRLLSKQDILNQANVIIAVAGMEGALPSVIAGLVAVPVIAVPTAVGYGVNFNGLTTLLAMLNSCSNGVSVVNIGNGFGAAIQADMINKLAVK